MLHRCKVLALTLITTATVFAQGNWSEVSLAPVQVSFPESPKLKVSSESTPVGPVTSNSYELKAADYTLTAVRTKLPKIALAFRSPEALYEEAARSLQEEHAGAQQTAYQKVSVAGKPGAEVSFTLPGGEQGKAQFVLVGEHLVTTQALWKNAKGYANVERFFGSLKG